MNQLYFGDNLDILREHIKDESIDLIYLDPPFNSKRDYNLLFKSPKGHESDAQITAFEDSWHWGEQAEREFSEILRQPNTDVAEMMRALRQFLGENDMMAYLTMMANRLLELHRVLNPTGSLYLHCDPTASHYLKIVLDGVFGKSNYRNEIIWRRTDNTGSSKSISKRFPSNADTLLFYTKGDIYFFEHARVDYSDKYKARFTKEDKRGFYYLDNLKTYSKERLEQLIADDRIEFTKNGKPRIKNYLHEGKGIIFDNVWIDILPINSQAQERLGYPTQKPLALLERIINSSCPPNGIVLDPFCGCGTAVHAAQKYNRQWIGIDITHLAISLVEKRLRDAFPDIKFEVHGTPKDLDGARNLAQRDKYQFQWWACSLVNAQPYQGKKKGADGGIDGLIFFQDEKADAKKIIVSVKGGESVGLTMLKDLIATVDSNKAQIGLFITLAEPSRPMTAEAAKAGYYDSPIGSSFPKIQILTIKGLLEGTERPGYPDLSRGGHTFKKAKKEEPSVEQKSLF